MVYKSQQDMMPGYITAHLTEYMPPRPLRSSEDKQLVVIKLIYIMGIYHFRWPRLNCGMPFERFKNHFEESIEDVFIQVELIV